MKRETGGPGRFTIEPYWLSIQSMNPDRNTATEKEGGGARIAQVLYDPVFALDDPFKTSRPVQKTGCVGLGSPWEHVSFIGGEPAQSRPDLSTTPGKFCCSDQRGLKAIWKWSTGRVILSLAALAWQTSYWTQWRKEGCCPQQTMRIWFQPSHFFW